MLPTRSVLLSVALALQFVPRGYRVTAYCVGGTGASTMMFLMCSQDLHEMKNIEKETKTPGSASQETKGVVSTSRWFDLDTRRELHVLPF